MSDDSYRRSRLNALLGGADAVAGNGASVRVGDYTLLRRLGAGGMGVVWLARDERLDRLAAVKVLAPHLTIADEAIWRFGQEATAAARLDHPSIVAVHGAGEFDGQRYLAMEFVDGVPLDRLLASFAGRRPADISDTEVQAVVRAELSVGPYADRPFTAWATPSERVPGWLGRVAAWGWQVAEGLHHAHSRGVIHRDIKPSNLLVDRAGTMRIVDFGLARIEEAAPITRTGAVLGTIVYMAPEALGARSEDLDARADIYSLGATLFELVALRPPYVSASLSSLVSEINLNEAPTVTRFQHEAPRDLAAVIAKCLARDRRDRYSTAQDLAEDMRRFLAGEPVRAQGPGTWRRLRAWARTHPRHAVAGGLFLVAAVAAGPAWSWTVRRSALQEADRLRTEGVRQLDESENLQSRLATTTGEYDALVATAGPSPPTSVAFSSSEKRLADSLAQLRRARAQALEGARFSLENAAAIEERFGGQSDATRAGRLRMALARLHDARAAYDDEAIAAWRDHGRRVVGTAAALPPELGDSGTVRFSVIPAGASAYVFRYESYDRVRAPDPVVPRLVPVPIGVRDGESRACPTVGLHPGDTCLVIESIEPASPLATAGLKVGDLIAAIDGHETGDGAFVSSVMPDGLAGARDVSPWDRINAADPVSIGSLFQWRTLDHTPATGQRRIAIGRQTFYCERGKSFEDTLGITVVGPDGLDACVPRRTVKLDVVSGGTQRQVELPGGHSLGARLRISAYPLVCSDGNRIVADANVRLAEGSYVALVRRDGFEDQRMPFVVRAGDDRELRVELRTEGSTPEGWIFVPDCDVEPEMRVNAWIENEPATPTPVPRVPSFVISRRELTLGEWFEFLNNAPGVRAQIVEALRDKRRPPLVPRALATEEYDIDVAADGTLLPRCDPGVPAYGISGADVEEFLRWKNERLRAENSQWLWDLPMPEQWVKAARGADRRRYPWGDRFYHALCVNARWPGEAVIETLPHEEPRDESPFGVWDMAGSRAEWCRNTGLHGGDWSMSSAGDFKITQMIGVIEKAVSTRFGFRPILVANPDHVFK